MSSGRKDQADRQHAADADVDDHKAEALHNPAGDALRNPFFEQQPERAAHENRCGIDDGSKHGERCPFRVV